MSTQNSPKKIRNPASGIITAACQPPDRRWDLWEPEPDPILKAAVFTPEWTMCDSGRTAASSQASDMRGMFLVSGL